MRHLIIEELRRVGYEGGYALIVPDHASGHDDRYSVYSIPSSPSRRVRVIGRELPLGVARKVATALRSVALQPRKLTRNRAS